MRIGGSIYNIYYLLGGIYCVYTTLYLHLSLLHSRAVNGSAICHLYTFEVRCESGMYEYTYVYIMYAHTIFHVVMLSLIICSFITYREI